MEKFQLSVFFKIIGIGSASGLLYQNDLLYIISDNSSYLYEYNIQNEKLGKIPLAANPQDIIDKKDKPDFEAITALDNELFILGSGSTEKRNRLVKYNKGKSNINLKDFSPYYQRIKKELSFTDDELNIEGLILGHTDIYFFQRGNGSKGRNGVIRCKGDLTHGKLNFIPFDLPKIKNVPATFTDAVLADGKIYFLASAEDTDSTYHDGEVLGSIIGTINAKTMKLEDCIQISDKNKFEGLTLYKKTAAKIEFLLCEDTDSGLLESTIYKLALSFKQ
jgi:hypothetical protein